jgi:hypothetical protein
LVPKSLYHFFLLSMYLITNCMIWLHIQYGSHIYDLDSFFFYSIMGLVSVINGNMIDPYVCSLLKLEGCHGICYHFAFFIIPFYFSIEQSCSVMFPPDVSPKPLYVFLILIFCYLIFWSYKYSHLKCKTNSTWLSL